MLRFVMSYHCIDSTTPEPYLHNLVFTASGKTSCNIIEIPNGVTLWV